MKLLVTGGFGTVGRLVLEEALRRGHATSVLEMETKRNRKVGRFFEKKLAGVHWGDIRDPALLDRAVEEQEAVIHLAAILPPGSEVRPELCRAVNVGGTRTLLNVLAKRGRTTALVFVSSSSVMGPTQDREPPVRVADRATPIDLYARTKVEAEGLVRSSGLPFLILRLAGVMPTGAHFETGMLRLAFEIPLAARVEVVVDLDAATACVSAAELLVRGRPAGLAGKSFFIGGGRANGCQMRGRDMLQGMFAPLGLSLPEEKLFAPGGTSYCLDWYDTEEAEQALHFQNHSFAECTRMVARNYRRLRPLVRFFRPLVVDYLAKQSPYRAA
jgi:nucleoside-diphosphate-sugar epimerase